MKFLQFLYNRENYSHHVIIKKLANEFKGEFNCLGKNTEKYKSFQFQLTCKLEKMIKLVKKM